MLLQWSPDAKKIYYTCSDKAPEPGKNDGVLRGKDLLTVRLYELDVATRKSRKISRGSLCCHEFSIAPTDGDRLSLSPGREVYFIKRGDAIYLVHAVQKKTEIIPDKDRRLILRRLKEI